MTPLEEHKMLAKNNHDEDSRQSFVNDFRVHLSSNVFPGNFPAYYKRVLPQFLKDEKREPKNSNEIRKVMNKIQRFDCLGTDYRAKIFYEKISYLEFE